MEQLAKIGITVTNILLSIGALLFVVFLTGILGPVGFVVSVLVSITSVTTWAMMVSAYNKFMDK